MPQSFGSTWQGTLRDIAHILYYIRRSRAFGRLSLRSKERLSVAHLYFQAGNLVHIVGNRGNMRHILMELEEWREGVLRFDRGIATEIVTTGWEYERILDEVLMRLRGHGAIAMPEPPHVIESDIIVRPQVKQLITPAEWNVLLEGMRRVLLAIAHLVGPQEALNVLRNMLDRCSSDFPAFAGLWIDSFGYLQVADRLQLDYLPREDLLAGFAALIAICEYFCVSLVGEINARKLLIQAFHELTPALVSLDVFTIDDFQFSKSHL